MEEPKIAEVAFRPRSRILEMLGLQLIKTHTLALFELIKNSYDADATKVDVTLISVDKQDGILEVSDNGDGMGFTTVRDIWMVPAHDHKQVSRDLGQTTKKGRLPVGEKGVGRFAVHRLGKEVTLVTRKEGNLEVFVSIKWYEIEEHEFLDQGKIKIIERKPEVFVGKRTGTRITVSGLREKWKRGEVRRLYKSVMSMTSPVWDKKIKEYDDVIKPKRDDFKVNFTVDPNSSWLKNLTTADSIKKQAIFFYDFLIDNEGFHYQYSFNPMKGLQSKCKKYLQPREVLVENKTAFEFFKIGPPQSGEKWRGRHRKQRAKQSIKSMLESNGIGPIRGRIAGFDLDKFILINFIPDNEGLTRFLKENGGVRVYRDGMRVYDYGEQGNDWLNLDHRRFQTPTRRVSNNLIIGEIHIRMKESCGLLEKTNREGFRENDSYQEFKYAVLCALMEFEVEREKDKKLIRDCERLTKEGSKSPKAISVEDSIKELKEGLLKKSPHNELVKTLEDLEKKYVKTRDVLLSAVGSGLGLTTIFHEIERGVRALIRAIKDGRPDDTLLAMSQNIDELLKGSMYLVSNSNSQKMKASEVVEYALFSSSERLKYHNITLLNGFEKSPGQDFFIKGVRKMLIASLVNLIDNAIHWIKLSDEGTPKKQRCIWIGPSHDREGPAIVIADSGSGFEDAPEDLVLPFFGRRSEGMGIGLFYCNMVMNSHGGRLDFPAREDMEVPKVCSGAVVAMVFERDE
jgi:hypothetical protein